MREAVLLWLLCVGALLPWLAGAGQRRLLPWGLAPHQGLP